MSYFREQARFNPAPLTFYHKFQQFEWIIAVQDGHSYKFFAD